MYRLSRLESLERFRGGRRVALPDNKEHQMYGDDGDGVHPPNIYRDS